MITIPEKELKITFSRSRGKGGQYLNKTSTKATLHWDVYNSQVLSPEQKFKVLHELHKRITEKGDLVLWAQSERSQVQNKKQVIDRLHLMVNKVLLPKKKRIPTKPSKAAKEKRLQQKKKVAAKKKLRKKVEY